MVPGNYSINSDLSDSSDDDGKKQDELIDLRNQSNFNFDDPSDRDLYFDKIINETLNNLNISSIPEYNQNSFF